MGRRVADRGEGTARGLAALDVLLADPEVLWPLVERWRQEFRETGRLVLTDGRPTIALEKLRAADGAQAALAVGVPDAGGGGVGLDASAAVLPDQPGRAGAGRVQVRKLTRRIGAETVAEMTRAMIVKATREKRFCPRAVRIDSTVSRPTSSIRPTPGWHRSAFGRWRGRVASSRSWSRRRRCGCGIVHALWDRSCAGSRARYVVVRGKRRPRCWR